MSRRCHEWLQPLPPYGRASLVRPHDCPPEGMVDVAVDLLAHCRPNVLGHRINVPQQPFGAFVLKLRMALQRLIRILHVSAMVLLVMNLHGLSVDIRLEGVKRVRQVRKDELGHEGSRLYA